MENEVPSTTFDSMTQTRQLQMLKVMIPYMQGSMQKNLAVLVKYMELRNTASVFSHTDQVLSMCSVPENEDRTLAMLNDLRQFCTEKECETIDMLSNMLSMFETYETIFS